MSYYFSLSSLLVIIMVCTRDIRVHRPKVISLLSFNLGCKEALCHSEWSQPIEETSFRGSIVFGFHNWTVFKGTNKYDDKGIISLHCQEVRWMSVWIYIQYRNQ